VLHTVHLLDCSTCTIIYLHTQYSSGQFDLVSPFSSG